MNIIFSSGGNDSVALIQWATENLDNCIVAYSDTQWASEDWKPRMIEVEKFVVDSGFEFALIKSEGFKSLVKRKKGFPANGMAFCSFELKIKPALEWLETIDPDKKATCYTGVMRIESKERAKWPVVVKNSPNHGDRKLVSPLACMTLERRDELLESAGFDILPYRSRECNPCVNATISDLQQLPEKDVIKVFKLEEEMGVGKRSGKPKYMFRPHRMGGACGIKQVKARADRGGGSFSPLQEDMFGCDSGFCGG